MKTFKKGEEIICIDGKTSPEDELAEGYAYKVVEDQQPNSLRVCVKNDRQIDMYYEASRFQRYEDIARNHKATLMDLSIYEGRVASLGCNLICSKRLEQIHVGRDAKHDAEVNTKDQLLEAINGLIHALWNTDNDMSQHRKFMANENNRPLYWDADIWQKLCGQERVKILSHIGAFAAAEIDRLMHIKNKLG